MNVLTVTRPFGSPAAASHPFYGMVPGWALYPLVVLSTVAAVIASQAVISGAFSLTRQAVLLGYCPRVRIDHTSAREIGQIYVQFINWALFIAVTLLLVLVALVATLIPAEWLAAAATGSVSGTSAVPISTTTTATIAQSCAAPESSVRLIS